MKELTEKKKKMIEKNPEPKKSDVVEAEIKQNKTAWKGFAVVMTIISIGLLIGLGTLTYNVMYNTSSNEDLMIETLNSIRLIETQEEYIVAVNTEEFDSFFVEFTKEYEFAENGEYVIYTRK